MLYITGEKDKLGDLMKEEEYQRTFASYQKEIYQRNPNLSHNNNTYLPSYTPIILVSGILNTDQKGICQNIQSFSPYERKTLYQMQDSNFDYLTQIVMHWCISLKIK